MSDVDVQKHDFTIRILDPKLDEHEIKKLIDDAVAEARSELDLDKDVLFAEVEGAFLGLGEVTAVLVLKKAATIAASGLLAGAAKKAGEFVFENYVAPRLRRANLVPSEAANESTSTTNARE